MRPILTRPLGAGTPPYPRVAARTNSGAVSARVRNVRRVERFVIFMQFDQFCFDEDAMFGGGRRQANRYGETSSRVSEAHSVTYVAPCCFLQPRFACLCLASAWFCGTMPSSIVG